VDNPMRLLQHSYIVRETALRLRPLQRVVRPQQQSQEGLLKLNI
jgi:hypothetical protein